MKPLLKAAQEAVCAHNINFRKNPSLKDIKIKSREKRIWTSKTMCSAVKYNIRLGE